MLNKGNKVQQLANNTLRFKWFLIKNLPLGFWVGLKLLKVDTNETIVSVPFKYLNKNPFHSMYFSVLSMAAELSTGVIGMAAIYDTKKPVSMLLLTMETEFVKKAKTKIFFTCTEGEKIIDTVNKSIENNRGEIIKVSSVGYDTNHNLVAKFKFTWTFKPKQIQQH
ncbi:MAG: DUF4442 domain-containing protein [Chlorobi bacterium]|nr:DUF4442 domain-containing protein [Chlorobiota bacterium]